MSCKPRDKILLAVLAALLLSSTASAARLTAGDIDDHLNLGPYQDYVDRTAGQTLPYLDVHDRITIQVLDRDGDPFPRAAVQITVDAEAAALADYVAGSDGIVYFLPTEDGMPGDQYTVTATSPDGQATVQDTLRPDALDGDTFTLHIDADGATPDQMDILLVIDTTGSMGDELDYLTAELQGIVEAVAAENPGVDVRLGLIAYRDHGDDYTVRDLGFATDLQEMLGWLQTQRASGGGDYPEAMDQALGAAADAQWRSGNTARMVFLVADAPPHAPEYTDLMDAARDLRRDGIHVHSLAASGVGDAAEYLMRGTSMLTQGRYMFLTDDSGIGNPHAEPKIPCYIVTSLEDLMARVIVSDLTGQRIEADAQDIVREVGEQERGVCLVPQTTQQQEQADDSSGDDGTASSSDGDVAESASDGTTHDDAATDATGDATYGTGMGRGGSDDGASAGEASDGATESTPAPGVLILLASLAIVVVALRSHRR